MSTEQTSRAVDAIAALGIDRLRPLASRVGADQSGDARALASRIVDELTSVDELQHQDLTDADIERIGTALGLGARTAWRPRMSAEEFERLPFYKKPSYDNDVWEALRACWAQQAGGRRARHAGAFDLGKSFVHLGLGATVVPQEPFTGMDWYERYGARHAGDGIEGRLVSMHTFATSWDSWEMHPKGHELVVCVAGRMVLIQEQPDGSHRSTTLETGQAAINPPGVWHTADVDQPATALFITAGVGTEHRQR